MSMREAFEKWSPTPTSRDYATPEDHFKAGYSAAIEAVKAGGPVAWGNYQGNGVWEPSSEYKGTMDIPLFRLPEDV